NPERVPCTGLDYDLASAKRPPPPQEQTSLGRAYPLSKSKKPPLGGMPSVRGAARHSERLTSKYVRVLVEPRQVVDAVSSAVAPAWDAADAIAKRSAIPWVTTTALARSGLGRH